MANSKVSARKESQILRELTLILNRDFQNDYLNAITISEVRLSRDNSTAKVFYSFIPYGESFTPRHVEHALNDAHKTIRMHLASKLKMRSVPDLLFVYDTSLQNANRIEEILKTLS